MQSPLAARAARRAAVYAETFRLHSRHRLTFTEEPPRADPGVYLSRLSVSFRLRQGDFDHTSDDKVASLGLMGSWPLAKIIAELEKCEVVCSNCHRHRTVQRNQT